METLLDFHCVIPYTSIPMVLLVDPWAIKKSMTCYSVMFQEEKNAPTNTPFVRKFPLK